MKRNRPVKASRPPLTGRSVQEPKATQHMGSEDGPVRCLNKHASLAQEVGS
jgi:hypothetical protein